MNQKDEQAQGSELSEQLGVKEGIAWGGAWLGAARTWMQWNLPNGSQIVWGSGEFVTLSAKQVEDLALHIAVAAVQEDRKRRNT